MTLPFRYFPRLTLLAVLPALLAAEEVQHLPAMAVTGPAGTHSAQPSVADLPAGADVSSGLADIARHTAGFTVSDPGARGFGLITTLRGLGNTPYFSDSSAPVYLDDIPLAAEGGDQPETARPGIADGEAGGVPGYIGQAGRDIGAGGQVGDAGLRRVRAGGSGHGHGRQVLHLVGGAQHRQSGDE